MVFSCIGMAAIVYGSVSVAAFVTSHSDIVFSAFDLYVQVWPSTEAPYIPFASPSIVSEFAARMYLTWPDQSLRFEIGALFSARVLCSRLCQAQTTLEEEDF